MMHPAITQGAGAEQYQGGAQTLAAGIDDVLGDLPHEDHIRMQACANDRVDCFHIWSDQVEKLLGFHRTLPWHKTCESYGGRLPAVKRSESGNREKDAGTL